LRVLEASKDRLDPAIATYVQRLAVEFARNRDTDALAGLNKVLERAWYSLLLDGAKERSIEDAFRLAAYRLFLEREPEVAEVVKIQNEGERSKAIDAVMSRAGRRAKWRELVECIVGRVN